MTQTTAPLQPDSNPAPAQPFPHRANLTDAALQEIQDRCAAMAHSPVVMTGVQTRLAQIADALRELIDRRREDGTTRGLERSFAFEFASNVLDGEALPAERDGEPDFDWLDLSSARGEDGEFPEHIEEASATPSIRTGSRSWMRVRPRTSGRWLRRRW
jgi:hypothetical protein